MTMQIACAGRRHHHTTHQPFRSQARLWRKGAVIIPWLSPIDVKQGAHWLYVREDSVRQRSMSCDDKPPGQMRMPWKSPNASLNAPSTSVGGSGMQALTLQPRPSARAALTATPLQHARLVQNDFWLTTVLNGHPPDDSERQSCQQRVCHLRAI